MYAASWRLGSHTDLDFICVSGFSPVLSANSRKRQYLNVRSSFGGLAADPPTQAGASSRKTIASSSQFLSKDQKYHLFKNKGKPKTDLSATYVQCFQFEDFQRKSWEWLGRPHIWPYLLCVGATWWRGGLWRNLFLSKFISHKFKNIFFTKKKDSNLLFIFNMICLETHSRICVEKCQQCQLPTSLFTFSTKLSEHKFSISNSKVKYLEDIFWFNVYCWILGQMWVKCLCAERTANCQLWLECQI